MDGAVVLDGDEEDAVLDAVAAVPVLVLTAAPLCSKNTSALKMGYLAWPPRQSPPALVAWPDEPPACC